MIGFLHLNIFQFVSIYIYRNQLTQHDLNRIDLLLRGMNQESNIESDNYTNNIN